MPASSYGVRCMEHDMAMMVFSSTPYSQPSWRMHFIGSCTVNHDACPYLTDSTLWSTSYLASRQYVPRLQRNASMYIRSISRPGYYWKQRWEQCTPVTEGIKRRVFTPLHSRILRSTINRHPPGGWDLAGQPQSGFLLVSLTPFLLFSFSRVKTRFFSPSTKNDDISSYPYEAGVGTKPV